MSEAAYRETVNLLFSAISMNPTRGLKSSFMFNNPTARGHMPYAGGVEIFYHRATLIKASLHIRKNGPPHLRHLAPQDIWSQLQMFITNNYYYLADEVGISLSHAPFSEITSEMTKERFASLLKQELQADYSSSTTIYPLVTIVCDVPFLTEAFFLTPAGHLNSELIGQDIPEVQINPNVFPPLTDRQGRQQHRVTSWLGVRAPNHKVARKFKAAILGAISLKTQSKHRYVFSGRAMFGGYCCFNKNKLSHAFEDPVTPPLYHDLHLLTADADWISDLSHKLMSSSKAVRRQLKALEYFYRAWPLDKSDRFPVLCMALDAIFGDANQATKAVIDGVMEVLPGKYERERIGLLMKLRASVIHGGAPDVWDSRKYVAYYESYDEDPISDMEAIVAECLCHKVFGRAI
ncbi:MAG: hypothetical protein ACFHHU_00910 [Porticoccaceae bacterium]